jgi:hypothetical protein
VTNDIVVAVQVQLTTLKTQMATNAELMNAMMATLMQQRGTPIVSPLTKNVLATFNQQLRQQGIEGGEAKFTHFIGQ